jgi:hypothetical protein
MTKVYAGNTLLDFDGVLTITKQAFDLTAPGTTRLNYTNRIVVPPTAVNLEALGFPSDISSASLIPYTQILGRVVMNGLEVIPKAIIYIGSWDANGITLNIYQQVITFWDIIDKKLLTDISGVGINTKRQIFDGTLANTTSGIVTPVIDYGDFVAGSVGGGFPYKMQTSAWLPSFYYHTILEKIIADAGYQISGTILANTKYLNTIIPFSRPSFNYAPDFVNNRKAAASAAGGQVIVTSALFQEVQFTKTSVQDIFGYWDGVSRYFPLETDPSAAGKNHMQIDVVARLNITVVGGTVELGFRETGGSSATYSKVFGAGTGDYTIATNAGGSVFDISITNGNYIVVYIRTTGGAPTVTINAGSSVSFTPRSYPSVGGVNWAYWTKMLPEMTQKDFMKDFAISFGQMFSEKNGVIYCKGIDEIIADRANAKIMTGKRNTKQNDNSRQFTPLSYAQVNRFQYSNSDTVNVAADFGEGKLLIANANISADKVIYKSPFCNAATVQRGTTGTNDSLYIAYIPIFSTSPGVIYTSNTPPSLPDFDNDPGIHKLLVRPVNGGGAEPVVQFNGTNILPYKLAYFDDPTFSLSMRWNTFIDEYYTLFRAALQKAKLENRRYMLDDIDVTQFDPFILWFDTDSYFIVNIIQDYMSGQEEGTKSQLLKV